MDIQCVTVVLPEKYTHIAPDGSAIRELLELEIGGLAHCTLPKGASGTTSHKTVSELWYCLSGERQIWRRGAKPEVDSLKPGVSVTIPQGTAFQFRNVGPEPLVVLIATIPKWPGRDEARPEPDYWE